MVIPSWLLAQRCIVEHFDDSGEDPLGNRERMKTGEHEYRCRLDQTRTREELAGRDTATTDFLLILPAKAIIDPGDEVLVEGRRYKVVGAPARMTAFRREHHVEAVLVYIEEVS